MKTNILGIHHITAIAGNAKRNFDFYTKVLGLRMVKRTVNFDDPGTYHFYFGDEVGSPGTILTFFPWENVSPGKTGTGMANEILYSVPAESLDFWKKRLSAHQVKGITNGEKFGQEILRFKDPDGLDITLVALPNDSRKGWNTPEVKESAALRGFQGITLTVRQMSDTARILTDIFDYKLESQERNEYRFITSAVDQANVVDLIEAPELARAVNAGGTIHHVAFRVANEDILMEYREKILSRGFNITPKIDRNYFYSLYFREPGGVLFELATDNPGFSVDEPVSELGRSLKLPAQYESHRAKIQQVLPVLD